MKIFEIYRLWVWTLAQIMKWRVQYATRKCNEACFLLHDVRAALFMPQCGQRNLFALTYGPLWRDWASRFADSICWQLSEAAIVNWNFVCVDTNCTTVAAGIAQTTSPHNNTVLSESCRVLSRMKPFSPLTLVPSILLKESVTTTWLMYQSSVYAYV